jgi:hypothetical protein
MNGKHSQHNGRTVIAILLVVLILAAAAMPALALEDAGTSASNQKQVALNDDEMGFLSLKVTHQTFSAPETTAVVGVDDEDTGYFSLDGPLYVETTSGPPAQVQSGDDEMRFLSLKAASQSADTSETQLIAQGQ